MINLGLILLMVAEATMIGSQEIWAQFPNSESSLGLPCYVIQLDWGFEFWAIHLSRKQIQQQICLGLGGLT